MLRFLILLLLTLLLGLYSIATLATTKIEESFTPQVTIIKKSTSGLEIDMQADFVAQYSASLGSFKPVTVPITVRSTDDSLQSYRIKLRISQHYCRDEGQADQRLNDVISTTLDGTPLSLVGSGLEGSDGLLVSGVAESEHVMAVTYSAITQKDVIQVCYGTFILIAEAVIL